MDDYDRTNRIRNHGCSGGLIGIVLGFLGGVFAQEYLSEASQYAQYFLDVLSGLGAGMIGGALGYIAGSTSGRLMNTIIEEEERIRKEEKNPTQKP